MSEGFPIILPLRAGTVNIDSRVLPDQFSIDMNINIWWHAKSKYVSIVPSCVVKPYGPDYMTLIAKLTKGCTYLRLRCDEGFFISSLPSARFSVWNPGNEPLDSIRRAVHLHVTLCAFRRVSGEELPPRVQGMLEGLSDARKHGTECFRHEQR